MKKVIHTLLVLMFAGISFMALADPPTPPPNPGGPSGGGAPGPVGAPIDGGLGLLLALGGIYGSIRVYQARKETKDKVQVSEDRDQV